MLIAKVPRKRITEKEVNTMTEFEASDLFLINLMTTTVPITTPRITRPYVETIILKAAPNVSATNALNPSFVKIFESAPKSKLSVLEKDVP